MKILYRYNGYSQRDIDNPDEFDIIRETEKGYWIATGYVWHGDVEGYEGPQKWVSKTGKKRYAYPTKQEAMVNYIARKTSQIKHCERMIKDAKKGLMIATEDTQDVNDCNTTTLLDT